MNRIRVNVLRPGALHPFHDGTVLKLTKVQYASLSAWEGSRSMRKKTNLLHYGSSRGKVVRHSLVREEALLRWLTGCVTLVNGFRLDGNCPVVTVCRVTKRLQSSVAEFVV